MAVKNPKIIVESINVVDDKAIIVWKTDDASSTQVHYSTSAITLPAPIGSAKPVPPGGVSAITDTDFVHKHISNLANLARRTLHTYVLYAINRAGGYSQMDGTFYTK